MVQRAVLKSAIPGFLVFGVTCLLGGGPAFANHIIGLRATVLDVEPTGDVELQITMNTNGEEITTTGTVLGFPPTFYYAGSPVLPAISWGEGETTAHVTMTKLSGETTYIGTFSHTYSLLDTHTIRVASRCCINTDQEQITTGSPVLVFANPTQATTFLSYAMTNTVQVAFSVLGIPVSSTAGLVVLSLLVAGGAIWLLRQS